MYSEYSLKRKSKRNLKAHAQSWAFKEGVFLTPRGKWIARVKDNKRGYVTLSQHDKESDAKEIYIAFYQNIT